MLYPRPDLPSGAGYGEDEAPGARALQLGEIHAHLLGLLRGVRLLLLLLTSFLLLLTRGFLSLPGGLTSRALCLLGGSARHLLRSLGRLSALVGLLPRGLLLPLLGGMLACSSPCSAAPCACWAASFTASSTPAEASASISQDLSIDQSAVQNTVAAGDDTFVFGNTGDLWLVWWF